MENALHENVRETENEFWERELEITMTSDHVLQSGFKVFFDCVEGRLAFASYVRSNFKIERFIYVKSNHCEVSHFGFSI